MVTVRTNRAVAGSTGDFTIALANLPVTHRDASTRGVGIFMVIFAALWGGIPTAALIAKLAKGEFEPGLLGLLAFTVIGIGLAFGGLALCCRRRETTIAADSVTVRARGLRGWTQWSEPLANYRGVRSRSEYHSGSKNQSSYTLYIVELDHADPKRVVRLYQSRSDAGFRAAWERCCRQLNLPAVVGEGDAAVARDVADLDKPVRELVREGKLTVAFDPTRPPAELKLRVDGATLELTVAASDAPAGCFVLLLVPAAAAILGFTLAKAPGWLGPIGLGALLFSIGMLIWARLVHEQIRIARDSIHVRRVHRWGATAGTAVTAKSVEMVRIGTRNQQSPTAVLIETDDQTVDFGSGLSRATQEWVRDCILHVLAA